MTTPYASYNNTDSSLIENIKKKFTYLYQSVPSVISCASGRAEIIGNHTDYNYGFALSAAINLYTYVAVLPRVDNKIYLFSEQFDTKPLIFDLNNFPQPIQNHWTNYIKAIIQQLSLHKPIEHGFDLMVTSSVPSSGGVSSSAALEISSSLALAKLFDINLSLLEHAVLCQKAENSPLVNSPCGFLDQATCALAKKNSLLFLDFLPKNEVPVSKTELIPISFDTSTYSFLIVVDPTVKRNLGSSGYPIRREMCQNSLPILSKILKRKVRSLREISLIDFDKSKNILEKENVTMRKRVEHIVNENSRVLDAVKAIKTNNLYKFGKLMTESGESALSLYELDEKTPELTFLVQRTRNIEGVLGVRNMGGGFSANIIMLIQNSEKDKIKTDLQNTYKQKFSGDLTFISFIPAEGGHYVN